MRFQVKARGPEGVVRLVLDALDAEDATAQAQARSYRVLTVAPARPWLAWRGASRPRLPLALFCQELLALLDSGLALVEALDTLAEKEERPDTRRLLDTLVAR